MFDKMLVDHANEARNDGMLHFSSGLQHERHAVLGYVHGYPEVRRSWGEVAQLITGTAIHEYLHQMFHNSKELKGYASEIPVSPVPVGDTLWTGTADAIVTDHDYNVWLVDYKTTSSNTFAYLNGKPKPEHVMQVSAYYHFINSYNLSAARCGILYIPVSPTFTRKWEEPAFIEFEPLPAEEIIAVMERVSNAITDYKLGEWLPPPPEGDWLWKFDKKSKKWLFKYKPHWSTRYCPWAPMIDDPCKCSLEKALDGGWYDPVGNVYELTEEGKLHYDSVTKPWELDNEEKV